jgi:hypothetical protein
METSHTMHFCDEALLASFGALGSGGVAVNASDGIVAFAPGPRGSSPEQVGQSCTHVVHT